MISKPKIVLIGGGGHCKSCIDVIEEENKYQIAGIVDVPEKHGEKILAYKVFAKDDDLPELIFIILLKTTGDNFLLLFHQQRIFQNIQLLMKVLLLCTTH